MRTDVWVVKGNSHKRHRIHRVEGEDNSKSAMTFAFVDEVVELSFIEVEFNCLFQRHAPMVQVGLLAKHSACVVLP